MNTEIKLTGVEKTMLLPLWGRIKETKKNNGLIYDESALIIGERLKLNDDIFETQQSILSQLAWAARAYNVDFEINEILNNENNLTVVNIGCGLDTAYFRLKNKKLKWFDLDLPGVVKIKKELFPEEDNYKILSGSVLSPEVYSSIKSDGSTVVVAVGLLYYFTQSEVKEIIKIISEHFKNFTLIIDYCSPRGIKVANKRVIGNIEGTKKIWGVKNKRQLKNLNSAIYRVKVYPIFKRVRNRFKSKLKRGLYISDILKIMSFAKIEFRQT